MIGRFSNIGILKDLFDPNEVDDIIEFILVVLSSASISSATEK